MRSCVLRTSDTHHSRKSSTVGCMRMLKLKQCSHGSSLSTWCCLCRRTGSASWSQPNSSSRHPYASSTWTRRAWLHSSGLVRKTYLIHCRGKRYEWYESMYVQSREEKSFSYFSNHTPLPPPWKYTIGTSDHKRCKISWHVCNCLAEASDNQWKDLCKERANLGGFSISPSEDHAPKPAYDSTQENRTS